MKSNSFFAFLVLFTFSTHASNIPELSKKNDYAFITNQESNLLDVIDLGVLKKIYEIELGEKPVGIDIDQINKKIYITNPKSNNITEIDLLKKTKESIFGEESPIGIIISKGKKNLFVTNWYKGIVSVININKKKIIRKIKVGDNPAGIELNHNSGDIYVANRGSNSISVIDSNTLNLKKTINVQKAPFGIFVDNKNKNIFVANVQSNSVSVIGIKKLEFIKNIKVGKWPYHVAFDDYNNKILVSNQRDNSISIIDANSLEVKKTIDDFCEYPEGINVNSNKKIAIVACWFNDEVAIIDLLDYSLKKKITTSGGPRAFGNFIIEN